MNTITLSHSLVNIQTELRQIGSNARKLSDKGRAILPLKPRMLGSLPPWERDVVMDTVEILFAAILRFVDAQIAEQRANDAVDVVAARLERGEADGTCSALICGSARPVLLLAARIAPIAMHAIIETAPELDLKERLLSASPQYGEHRRMGRYKQSRTKLINLPADYEQRRARKLAKRKLRLKNIQGNFVS